MKQRCVFGVLVLLAICTGPPRLLAQDGIPWFGINGTAYVTKRPGAAIRVENRVVGTIPNELTVVEATEQKGQWLWVTRDDAAGWISRNDLLTPEQALDLPKFQDAYWSERKLWRQISEILTVSSRPLDADSGRTVDETAGGCLVCLQYDTLNFVRVAYLHRQLGFDRREIVSGAIEWKHPWIDYSAGEPSVYLLRGLFNQDAGKFQSALDDMQTALQKEPNHAAAHDRLAWLLATCPDKQLRDGARAVQHAKRACELTRERRAKTFETLAAALAESGDFDAAAEAQGRALSVAAKFKSKVTPASEKLLQSYMTLAALKRAVPRPPDLPEPLPDIN